jgi:hypothetical protein
MSISNYNFEEVLAFPLGCHKNTPADSIYLQGTLKCFAFDDGRGTP